MLGGDRALFLRAVRWPEDGQRRPREDPFEVYWAGNQFTASGDRFDRIGRVTVFELGPEKQPAWVLDTVPEYEGIRPSLFPGSDVRVAEGKVFLRVLIRCLLADEARSFIQLDIEVAPKVGGNPPFQLTVRGGYNSGSKESPTWEPFLPAETAVSWQELAGRTMPLAQISHGYLLEEGGSPVLRQLLGKKRLDPTSPLCVGFRHHPFARKEEAPLYRLCIWQPTASLVSDDELFGLPIGHKETFRVTQIPLAWEGPDRRAEWLASWGLVVEVQHSGERVQRIWEDKVVRPYRSALDTIVDGRPLSTIPRLGAGAEDISWQLLYSVWDGRADSTLIAPGQVEPLISDPREGVVAARPISLQPSPLRTEKRPDQPHAHLHLDRFLTHAGEQLIIAGEVVARHQDSKSFHGARGIEWAFRHLFPGGEQVVRLGALDLRFPGHQLAGGQGPGKIERLSAVRASFDPHSPTIPRLEVSLYLGLAGIAPGGQDDLPEEVRLMVLAEAPEPGQAVEEAKLRRRFEQDPALLIPWPRELLKAEEAMNATRSTGSGLTESGGKLAASPPVDSPDKRETASEGLGQMPLRLEIREFTAEGTSQVLRMNLFQNPNGVSDEALGKGRVLVFDPEPFLFARVRVPPLRADAESGEIGNWSGNAAHGASWELLSSEAVEMDLPPQTLGEEMEKGTGFSDLKEGKPADFRFSPAARFEVAPSYFEQRFTEAPWNLRRILGYPGQRAPGAEIESMNFELLYGLGCRVTAPFLRLAELSSRLGHVPGALRRELPWSTVHGKQKATYKALRERWSETYDRYLSRLAVLEPWDERQATLLLEEGVDYRLRQSARLRYPIEGDKPRNERIPADPDGLAGSYSWAFESKNLYEALWRDPASTSGRLARPFFSALGGWGEQKASFDNDRAAVLSSTHQGRVSNLTLERIGRIGVFWNLAKHVIVYERTIAPSDRFADEQDKMLGRPALRKVREYVEVLEPKRSYPDFGGPSVARGCVQAIEFKTRVIPVLSRWGEDVNRRRGGVLEPEGWKVPLWNRDADAGIYPKPHVVFELAGDPEGDAPCSCPACDEPDKLFFYTSVRPELDARTDLWPPVAKIDFPDQPQPKAPSIPAFDRRDMDRPLPDPAPVAPGYRSFTWALAPGAPPANVVAERSGEPMMAALRNVTMARSRPREDAAASAEAVALRAAVRAEEGVRQILDRVLAEIPTEGKVTQEVKNRLKGALGQLREFDGTVADLKQTLGEIRNAKGYADQFLDGDGLCAFFKQQAAGALDAAEKRLAGEIGNLVAQVEDEIDRIEATGDGLKRQAQAAVEGAFDQFELLPDTVSHGLDQVETQLAAVEATVAEGQAYLRRELDLLRARADSVLKEDKNRFLRDLAIFRGRAVSFLRQAEQAVGRVEQGRLATVAAQLRKHLACWRVQLDQHLRAIGAAVSGGADRVQEEIDELGRFLTSWFNATVQILTEALWVARDGLAKAREGVELVHVQLAEAQKALLEAINEAAGTPAAIKAKIREGAESFIDGKLEEAIGAAKKLAEEAVEDHLCGLLGEAEKALKDAVEDLLNGGLLDAAEGIIDGASDTADALREELEALADDVGRQVGAYAERVREGLEDLVDDALAQLPDTTLRLFRAFGDAPAVPNLGFNRDRLGYYFDELNRAVDLTPVTGFVNRLGDQLKSLGLRVPTRQLADRLLPDALQDFDISQIFRNLAGIKLDRLFPGAKLPALATDKVKVSHGVDPQTRRGWLQADVDVPMDKPADLFAAGPVIVRMPRARFEAQARVEAGLSGPPKQRAHGRLTADWQLQVGGYRLVTFRDTALRFDDSGRLHFDVDPKKIQMDGALQFLSDLASKFSSEEDGFTVRLLEEKGPPVGMEALLEIPVPDVQFGAFGISNLHFGTAFVLRAVPDFSLGLHLHLGSKEAPFALTIYVLSGGGWLDVKTHYLPAKNQLTGSVSIALSAGASLAFRFGPVKGGVSALVSLEVASTFGSDTRGTLTVAPIFLVQGEVRVAGFISVYLGLLLEARYRNDGALTARGTLRLEIKICWCFTLKVKASVTYTLSKGKGSDSSKKVAAAALVARAAMNGMPPAAEDAYTLAAKAYIEMIA